MDDLTGLLLGFMLLFGPWAFGATVPWAVWTINGCAYALTVLWLLKLAIRLKGYSPPRWQLPTRDKAVIVLGIVTILLLVFCFISAANARATFIRAEYRLEYHECIRWLPHSLDSRSSWQWFWNCLALAGVFWGARDWLPGKSRKDQQPGANQGSLLPGRLRVILWLLAINGALLAVEGIVQRIEGSGRLLFLVKPRVNPTAESQFGPWAYRGSAASYFNLLWPVCLGFWWSLQSRSGRSRKYSLWLLACAAVMAACPFISISRGGSAVAAGQILGILVVFVFVLLSSSHRSLNWRSSIVTLGLVLACAAVAVGLGYHYGWKQLAPRLQKADLRLGMDTREEMNENARPMARDYPLFGTGPGTFEPVFQLYRRTEDTYWPAQLHNDWLETRITFGWVGSGLLAAAFILAVTAWFRPGPIHGTRRFVLPTWLALAGCMVHARFDMPFQIYSILFLWIVLCAILSVLTRYRSSG